MNLSRKQHKSDITVQLMGASPHPHTRLCVCLANDWTRDLARRHTTAPINHIGPLHVARKLLLISSPSNVRKHNWPSTKCASSLLKIACRWDSQIQTSDLKVTGPILHYWTTCASRWPKVSNQAAKYGDMWKKMPAARRFFLQTHINLGHFWSLVFLVTWLKQPFWKLTKNANKNLSTAASSRRIRSVWVDLGTAEGKYGLYTEDIDDCRGGLLCDVCSGKK